MPIKFCKMAGRIFLLVFIFALGTKYSLWATTVEVENEDDDISVVPTPMSKTANVQVTPPNGEAVGADLEMEGESKETLPHPSPTPLMTPTPVKKKSLVETPTPTAFATESQAQNELAPNSLMPPRKRVRISDKVGFYYFVSSGFFVSDPSQLHSIAKVIGSADESLNFSTPKRTYIELSSDHDTVKPDDLLVVFRAVHLVHEPHSGVSGYPVENLAIVKVVEVQKKRVLVEVQESFGPFQSGDRVETYDNEIKRWKQAQIKKELPPHPITCFVLGGRPDRQNYAQTDFIYLSAGTKTGVVEGQNFDLREIVDTGGMEEPLHVPRGIAQVVFTGLNYSTAQIIRSNASVKKSFEAVYQP